MIEIDDSLLTPAFRAYLAEWARELGITVEVLAGRILAFAIDGDLYIEKQPNYRP
jgi:hypothetical protein